MIEFDLPTDKNSIIKVIGVGGGGSNAVNTMYEHGIEGVEFYVSNTDLQALDKVLVNNKIQLGLQTTEGLGAGANPEVGKKATQESIDQIKDILKNNTKMLFVTAGMGGGTGTGGAPIIAQTAKEMGILTVGIVTMPFKFEAQKRYSQAELGIAEMEKAVDTLIVIQNENLLRIFGNNVTMKQAFDEADSVLSNAAKGIADIITKEGMVNVDFNDVKTIMTNGGTAIMGSATCSGDDRAKRAVDQALTSPLLNDVDIYGAKGILVNITACEESLRLSETSEIMNYVKDAVGEDAMVIFGTVYDKSLADKLSLTVIVTGFDDEGNAVSEKEQAELTKASLDLSAQPTNNLVNSDFVLDIEEQDTEVKPAHLEEKKSDLEREVYKKSNYKEYNYHDSETLQNLEDIPAYKRRQYFQKKKNNGIELSKITLDSDEFNGYTVNDHNSFLHDNVD